MPPASPLGIPCERFEHRGHTVRGDEIARPVIFRKRRICEMRPSTQIVLMIAVRTTPNRPVRRTHRCQIVTLSDFKSAEGASPEFHLAQGSLCESR